MNNRKHEQERGENEENHFKNITKIETKVIIFSLRRKPKGNQNTNPSEKIGHSTDEKMNVQKKCKQRKKENTRESKKRNKEKQILKRESSTQMEWQVFCAKKERSKKGRAHRKRERTKADRKRRDKTRRDFCWKKRGKTKQLETQEMTKRGENKIKIRNKQDKKNEKHIITTK